MDGILQVLRPRRDDYVHCSIHNIWRSSLNDWEERVVAYSYTPPVYLMGLQLRAHVLRSWVWPPWGLPQAIGSDVQGWLHRVLVVLVLHASAVVSRTVPE